MTPILRLVAVRITERVGPEALATILAVVVVVLAVFILLRAVGVDG